MIRKLAAALGVEPYDLMDKTSTWQLAADD